MVAAMVVMKVCSFTRARVCVGVCVCVCVAPSQCLKYRTNKREDVKNLEKLSAWVINLTTSKVSHSGVVDGGASEASTRHGNKRHRTQSGGRDTKRKSGAQRRRAKKARAK